jgi:hypothetical protein
MSDIKTQANNGDDSFAALAADTVTFITVTVKALAELAAIENASADSIQNGLAVMAVMGRTIAMDFADRGIALSGPVDMVETGNDEDAEDYAFDVVH